MLCSRVASTGRPVAPLMNWPTRSQPEASDSANAPENLGLISMIDTSPAAVTNPWTFAGPLSSTTRTALRTASLTAPSTKVVPAVLMPPPACVSPPCSHSDDVRVLTDEHVGTELSAFDSGLHHRVGHELHSCS